MADIGIKCWLYTWLSKKKMQPVYEIRNSGPSHRQRFLCEVRVDSFPYVGVGNSTSKKDAQTNAAKDFVQYLIRQGSIAPNECPALSIPTVAVDGNGPHNNSEFTSFPGPAAPMLPVPGLKEEGNVYRPIQREGRQMTYMDKVEERKALEEAEDVDLTANIHGNWTIENAKSRLNMFFQQNRIKADYIFKPIGPDHNKSFVAEMSFYVKVLARTLYGRETGSNKQAASKSCALSLVRQLYHLNVFEAFSGTLKKKDIEVIESYKVNVSKDFENQIDETLSVCGIKPNVVPEKCETSVNLISDIQLDKFDPVDSPVRNAVVPWSPPQPNWNPWTACNLDEGPLANMTLDQLSEEMQSSWQSRLQTDTELQNSVQERQQLPVFSMKQPILDAINNNPVVIIRGNTGCGKTTQVCQFILDDYIQSGSGAYCNIVVTQPRRISAVSVSDRVANERREELGQSIGYSVRFESQLPRPYGGVLFCTVGVLLKKLEAGLRGVSHVIVDEIHERDLNTDFVLIVLRDMVRAFPDVRVILMSATIDISLFSDYFGSPAVIEVEGRAFPVDHYFMEDFIELSGFVPTPDSRKRKRDKDEGLPLPDDEPEENLNLNLSPNYSPQTCHSMSLISERDINFEIIRAILKHIVALDVEGAVLIFLPGWNVIFSLMKHLQQDPTFGNPNYLVLPLHSQLPREDQRRVFEPVNQGMRKIILATNIAESSITINDVVFVIDSCRAKMKLFTSHNNMTNYATVWASRTNLEQRKGRAGRVRPGMCFHLCSKNRFEKLDEHMTAEMFRTPLHEIGLSIKLLKLGSIGEFLSKAIQAPPIDAVIEAEVTLREMKCLDQKDELTPLGRILARLPIEPRLGKMVVLGCIFFCGDAMCTVAAHNVTSPEIFIIPPEYRRLSPFQRAFAGSRYSDHIAVLNVFNAWEEARQGGEEAEINFCDYKLLSMPTLRVTWEAKNQLKELLMSAGFPEACLFPQAYNFCGPDSKLDTVVGLLTSGHYPNVCYHKEKRRVLTQESKSALIHKSSVNCVKEAIVFPSPFFVFGEKIRTKAVSCKQMTMVTPIHLLLLGSRKVEFVDEVVRLDGWLNLTMDPQLAAKIVALRPAIDSLIVRAAKDPESLTTASEMDDKVINCLKSLFNMTCGRQDSEQVPRASFNTSRPPRSFGPRGDNAMGPPPFKRRFGAPEFRSGSPTPSFGTPTPSFGASTPSFRGPRPQFGGSRPPFRGSPRPQFGGGFPGNAGFARGRGYFRGSNRGGARGGRGGWRPRF